MNELIPPTALRRTATALAATAALLGGCSSIENFFSGDKVDYRSQATKTTAPLEVPPDLTQLARDGRFRPQGGVVSASAAASANLGAGAATGAAVLAVAPTTVAPAAMGAMKIERDGSQRWLAVPMSPEQLWPLLQAFWQERGFALEIDNASTGVMETNWAETRANIPQGAIRNALSKVFDSLYSSGERDRSRP